MTTLLMSLLSVGVLGENCGSPADSGEKKVVVVMARSDAEDSSQPEVFVLAGDPVVVGAMEVSPAFIAAGTEGSGWLGVQLSEVPPPLAAQLGLKDTGIMLANVVEGSPADQAGLERWDVIVSVDGQEISGGVPALAEKVGVLGEGKKVELRVIRNGQEVRLTATLGSAANAKEPKWKYPFAPEMAVRKQIRDHVRALEKGPGGHWEVKDLGDLDELKDLPDSVRKMFPHTEGITTRIEIENGNKTIHSSVERDGVTLEIEQEGEGEITVRRTPQDGAASEHVFPDEEALKAGDAEAYDVYSGMADGAEIEIDLHGLDNLDLGNMPEFKRKFQFKLDGPDEDSEEVRGAIEEAHRAFREAMKDVPDQDFFYRFGGPHGHARWFNEGEEGEEGDGDVFMHRLSAPRQTFKVMPDGSIELHARHGETEVIEVYRDENDLSARNPEMFEKFNEVHESTR